MKVPTPVNLNNLRSLIEGYDEQKSKCLINCFEQRFRIYSDIACSVFDALNLVSANQNPNIVDIKLQKELDADRIAGPFVNPPMDHLVVSPLGIVPKTLPGEYRMIHHLSYPKGHSVNDGIDPEFSSVSYASIDDAIRFMAKTDIQSF